jgi:hypothetical protein
MDPGDVCEPVVTAFVFRCHNWMVRHKVIRNDQVSSAKAKTAERFKHFPSL